MNRMTGMLEVDKADEYDDDIDDDHWDGDIIFTNNII